MLALFLALSTAPAWADDKPADPKTQADQLFEEGVALRNQGQFKEACVKFEEAMKHDERAIGTLLNLALCAEKFDKYATAVHLYEEARDRAKEQGLVEHQKAAEEHIATLAPKVSHVTITLAEQLPGTKVLVDDKVIAVADLTNLPIDAGARTLNVSAPGRLPYETRLTIEIGKDTSAQVPALAASVKVVSSRRTIGKLATIGGAVAVGAGIGLGIVARSMWNGQFDAHTDAMGATYFPCRDKDHPVCDSGGKQETEKARTIGTVGTVVGVVGLAAVAAGVTLWVTAPHAEARAEGVALVPVGGADQVGLAAVGRF